MTSCVSRQECPHVEALYNVRTKEDKYSRYVEDKKKGLIADKIRNKWYNDFSMVGAIGELWTAYKKFFEINSYKVCII